MVGELFCGLYRLSNRFKLHQLWFDHLESGAHVMSDFVRLPVHDDDQDAHHDYQEQQPQHQLDLPADAAAAAANHEHQPLPPPVNPFPVNQGGGGAGAGAFVPIQIAIPGPLIPYDSPVWTQVKGLSLWKKIFWLLFVVLYVVFLWSDPLCAAFVPLTLIPTALLFYRWTKMHTVSDFEIANTLYIVGFLPGSLLVLVAETIITILFGLLCFYDQISEIRQCLKNNTCKQVDPSQPVPFDVSHNFGFYLFLFLLSYVSAAGCEETLKYWGLSRIKRWRGDNYRSIQGILFFSLCTALGFSTVENIGYQRTSCAAEDATALAIFLNALARVCISTPVHLMTSYIMAIGFIRRDVFGEALPFWKIMRLPVFFHGTFDFILMLVTTAESLSPVTSFILTSVFVVLWIFIMIGTIVYLKKKHGIAPANARAGEANDRPAFERLENQVIHNDVELANPNAAGVGAANQAAYTVQGQQQAIMSQQQWTAYWHTLTPQQQAYFIHQHQLQQQRQQAA